MKKRFLVMAMAGVALAGCVNDEVSDVVKNQEPVKIVFEAPIMYDNAETRAEPGEVVAGDRSYSPNEKFVVFAVKHTNNFAGWASTTNIDGEEIPNNTYLWGNLDRITVKYNPEYNGWAPWTSDGTPEGKWLDFSWKPNMKASFSAYSPADAVNDLEPLDDTDETIGIQYGATGLIINDFKVNDTPHSQYDLMFSSRNVDVTHSNHTFNGYSGIPIRFHHALASIRFAIVSDKDAKLNGIKVNNIKNIGDFFENIINETEYTLGVNVNPYWANQRGEQDYTIYDNLDVPFTKSPQFILNILANNHISTNAKNFLMIPQKFEYKNGTIFSKDYDAHLEVDYQVLEDVNNQKVYVSHKSLIPLKDFFNGEWHRGTRHIYILSLGSGSKIYFAPGVEAWEEMDEDALVDLSTYTVNP